MIASQFFNSPLRSYQLENFLIGNKPLLEHQKLTATDGIHFHPGAWLAIEDLSNDFYTLVDALGEPIAWRGQAPDLSQATAAEKSFIIRHPWDLLRANEYYLSNLTESLIEGDVHPLALIEGIVEIGVGTRILPGVFIEGNVVIGRDCKIGPNCYLRGHTSIGDGCHIGQAVEIKNSLILQRTCIGHLSYIGDSVIGQKVNFGAGTITSNLRHDGANQRAMVAGELVDTGRRKLGAIVGDGVHTGIHTSIYPGRQLWPHSSTLPGEIVRKDLRSPNA